MIDRAPHRCGRCGHTVRDGELYENRLWESDSGSPYPGVAHTPACPTQVPPVKVPCPPCLAQLLTGLLTVPHACRGSTWLEIRAGLLTGAATRRCPCPCRRGAAPSDRLGRGRAASR